MHFAAHAALKQTPDWLDSHGLHSDLPGRTVAHPADRALAARKYADLVNSVRDGERSIWRGNLRGQVFLGDGAFVNKMLALAAPVQCTAVDVPKAQQRILTTSADFRPVAMGHDPALNLARHMLKNAWPMKSL